MAAAFVYFIQSERNLNTGVFVGQYLYPSSTQLTLPSPPPSPSQIPNGEYTGFIKVQLELKRPVTVRGGTGPEAGEEAFYLPQGSANTLHVSSESTVKQVTVREAERARALTMQAVGRVVT